MYLDMKINDYDSRIHNDIDYLHEFFFQIVLPFGSDLIDRV